jgi:hypothetical protein
MCTLRSIILGSAAALLLAACASPASEFGIGAAPAQPPPAQPPDFHLQDARLAAPSEPVVEAQPRLIIRTADLTLVVKDTQESLDALARLASEFGGFVVSSSTSRVAENALEGSITLRVEAARFNEALARIRALAVEVRGESVRGEDITAEYVDLDARLRNLEAAEAQLQQILKQATTTEDVLAVYRELTNLRGQIEQVEGRIKYLSQASALATITITLIPDALAQPLQVGGWQPAGVVRDALQALISALQGLATLLIWLAIVVAPMALVIAVPIVLIVLAIRCLRRNKLLGRVQQPTS